MDWKQKFLEHLHFATEKLENDYYIVGVTCKGSQNYELATKDSDMDTIAIVIPRWHTLLEEKTPISTTYFLPNGEQMKVKDVRVFCKEFPKSWSYWEMFTTDIYYWDNKLSDIFYKPMKENLERFSGIDPYMVLNSILGNAYKDYHSPRTGKSSASVLWFAELGQRYAEGIPVDLILKPANPGYLLALKENNIVVSPVELNRALSNLEVTVNMSAGIPRDEAAVENLKNICTDTLSFAYRFLIKL